MSGISRESEGKEGDKGKGMEKRRGAEVGDDGIDGPQYIRMPQGSTELVAGYELFQSAEGDITTRTLPRV